MLSLFEMSWSLESEGQFQRLALFVLGVMAVYK
jgi:hypothetical protein